MKLMTKGRLKVASGNAIKYLGTYGSTLLAFGLAIPTSGYSLLGMSLVPTSIIGGESLISKGERDIDEATKQRQPSEYLPESNGEMKVIIGNAIKYLGTYGSTLLAFGLAIPTAGSSLLGMLLVPASIIGGEFLISKGRDIDEAIKQKQPSEYIPRTNLNFHALTTKNKLENKAPSVVSVEPTNNTNRNQLNKTGEQYVNHQDPEEVYAPSYGFKGI